MPGESGEFAKSAQCITCLIGALLAFAIVEIELYRGLQRDVILADEGIDAQRPSNDVVGGPMPDAFQLQQLVVSRPLSISPIDSRSSAPLATAFAISTIMSIRRLVILSAFNSDRDARANC